jgi:hypothetical protein
VGTNVLEEDTASIFRVEVSKVGKMAGYIEVEGKEIVNDDRVFGSVLN